MTIKDLSYISSSHSIFIANSLSTIFKTIKSNSAADNFFKSWKVNYNLLSFKNIYYNNQDSVLEFDRKRARAVWYDSVTNIFGVLQ